MSEKDKKPESGRNGGDDREEMYRTLFEQAADGIFVSDSSGRYLDVNPRGCEMLGYTREEILSKTIRDLLSADELAATPLKLDDLRAGKTVVSERNLICKDGALLPVEISAQMLSDGRLLGITRDNRERKKTGQLLVESEARYRSVLGCMLEGCQIIDPNLRYVYVNDAVAAQGHHKPEELIGRTMMEAYPGIEETPLFSTLKRCMEERIPERMENKFTFPDGSFGWFELSLQPVPEGLFILSIDITARVERESETENLSRFPSENPNPVMRVTDQGIILYANEASQELLDAWGCQAGGELPSEWRERVGSLASRGSRELVDVNLPWHIYALDIVPVAGSDYLNIYGRDVTEQREAETRIKYLARLYATLSQVNQTIVRTEARDELFRSICEVAVRFGEFPMAWIGLLNHTTRVVEPVATAGQEQGYLKVNIIDLTRKANRMGPIGKAIQSGQVEFSDDIASDPGTIPWRNAALERGFLSVSAVPIRQGGQIIGSLNLYARETGFFSEEERGLLDEIGLDISYALDRIESEAERRRAEKSLRESEDRFHLMFEHHNAVMLLIEPESGQIVEANAAAQKFYGYPPEQLKQMKIQEINTLSPEEVAERRRQAVLENLNFFVFPHQLSSGEIRTVEVHSSPISHLGKTLLFSVIHDITERKRAEEALRLSEDKFSKAFLTSPDSININRLRDGVYIEINRGFTQMTGYTPEEVIGKSFLEIQIWNDPKDRDKLVQILSESGQASNLEAQFRLKDGTVKTGLMSATLITINGETCILSITRDISDRKQAEGALVASEQRYRQLFENNQAGVYYTSLDGTIMDCNEVFASILGYESSEEIKKHRASELYFDDAERAVYLEELKARGSLQDYELRLKRKDGSPVWILENVSLAKDDSGQPLNTQGTLIDITERKRAEEALRASEKRYRQLFETNQAGVFYTSLDGRIIGCNDTFAHIFGYNSSDEMKSHSAKELYPDVEVRIKYLEELKKNGSLTNYELLLQRKDGSPVWILENVNIAMDETGQPTQVQGTLIDLTERKRAEERLRESEERYRNIFEKATEGIFQSTQEGRFLSVNPAMAHMYGYASPEEMISIVTDIRRQVYANPDDREKFRVPLLHEGVLDGFEIENLRKDGSRFWILSNSREVRDAEGNLLYYEGTVRDISAQKQAETLQEAVYRIAQTAQLSDSLEELVPQIHKVISGIMPAGNFYIALFDDKHGLLNFPYSVDEMDPPISGSLPLGKGLTEYVLRTGKSLLCPQPVHDELEQAGEVELVGAPAPIWLGVPLKVDTRTIGVMAVQHYSDPLAYGEREQRILEFVSSQVAIALSRKQAETALRESEARFATVFRSSPMAIAITRLRDGQFIDVNDAWLNLTGFSRDDTIGHTPLEMEVWTDPLERERLVSTLNKKGTVDGFEFQMRKKSGEITDMLLSAELINLSGDACMLSMALDISERKRSESKIRQQVSRLTALNTIDRVIASSFDLGMTLNMLVSNISQQLNVSAAKVMLYNPNSLVLEYAAGYGFRGNEPTHLSIHLGEQHAGKVALERRMEHFPDLTKADPPFDEYITKTEGFISYFGLPLIAKGEVKGVLEVFDRQPLDPEADWLAFLETMAEQAAIAIDNMQLFEGMQRSNLELSLAYDATIEGWSYALDLRDKETEGHTQRVTDKTVELARAFGLDNHELVHIRRGALLHDIGKMGVPDAILLKPSALTAEEWVVMKMHPTFAHQMLERIQYLKPALDIPSCHHERWDGSGYPRGLSGRQIPLAARIFAVVDVWDALSSDRPYRPAWPRNETIKHIRAAAGTHFDPEVVEMFLNLEPTWNQSG